MTQPLDTAAIQARCDAATPGTWYLQPRYGPDFVATEVAGYERGIGTLDFGVGDQAEDDREFVLNAHSDISALLARVAELEAKHTALEAACDGLAEAGRNESRIWAARVAELEQQLAKYVGYEPTIAEEMTELGRRLNAVEQLIPAHPDDDPTAPYISPRMLRNALDGDTLSVHPHAPDEWLRCSALHCPNAERYAKAAERGWLSTGMGQWLCPDCRTTPSAAPGAR